MCECHCFETSNKEPRKEKKRQIATNGETPILLYPIVLCRKHHVWALGLCCVKVEKKSSSLRKPKGEQPIISSGFVRGATFFHEKNPTKTLKNVSAC